MKKTTKLAADIKVGDWLIEPDGAALEIRRKQIGSDFVILHFTPLGISSVSPLKIHKATQVEVMVKEEN